jgi:signal transduction histidine kinase/ligand-binding sensor domain-containing protein
MKRLSLQSAVMSCFLLATRAHSAPADGLATSSIKDNFHHVAWTSEQGAPAGIWGMAQTPDGWLWLSTGSGLYRFDGVSFHAIDLRPPDSLESRGVRGMLATRGGDLWVALSNEDLVVLIGGARYKVVPAPLPGRERALQFAEDSDGNVWTITASSKCFVRRAGEWELLGPEWQLPPGEIQQMMLDGQGSLWMASDRQFSILRRGAPHFENAQTNALPDAMIGISQAGLLWKQDKNGLAPLEGPDVGNISQKFSATARNSQTTTLLSRDGSWWSIDCPKGVCRSLPSGAAHTAALAETSQDVFTRTDGLSSDGAMALMEDREGSIWVGSKKGLDQFRRNDVVNVRFPSAAGYFAMAPDATSGIWTGTDVGAESATDYLWKIDPLPTRFPGFSGDAEALLRDPDGSILIVGAEKAWRFMDGQVRPLDIPKSKGHGFRTLARDGDGRLWASFLDEVTYRLEGSEWVRRGGMAEVPDTQATATALDASGTLWLGFRDNRVALIKGSAAKSYARDDGLSTGPVTAILPGQITLLGGQLGLNGFDGKRFVALHSDRPETLKEISGIIQTHDGSFWLNGAVGVVRISVADIERAMREPGFIMPSRVFDAQDGAPGKAQQAIGTPSLVEDKQGRIWIGASDGLAWLDPTHVNVDAAPTKVEILSMSTATGVYAIDSNLRLPAGTRELAIRYAGLSLAMPSRIRFRAQLLGIDNTWRELGNARSVSYSNLGPGAYTLQVMASNSFGAWSESPASVSFHIEPRLHQTLAFRVFCVVLLLALLLWGFRLQGARAAARISARMEERLKERERIARELHDTLLQDIEALGLNLRAINQKHGDSNPAHLEISLLDEATRRSLDAARASVGELRVESRSGMFLSEQLGELAEKLALLYPSSYRLDIKGEAEPLHPAAADEILAIGREAILNAFRHARASSITISLQYTARTLELRVCDDGAGLPANELGEGDRPGHWGLRGMRERAGTLEAELTIAPINSGGTMVRLRVSAAIAYAGRPSRRGRLGALLARYRAH